MPYEWTPNPVFLEHEGPHGIVSVYHVFKDDSYDCGAREFWYGLTEYASDQGDENGEFDVRDLKAAEGVVWDERAALLTGDDTAIRATILKAIASGELRWPQDDEEQTNGQG